MSQSSGSEDEAELPESEINSDSDSGPRSTPQLKGPAQEKLIKKRENPPKFNRDRSRGPLTLGTIILELMDTCGKAKTCPPPLVNNKKNVDVFLKSVLKYTIEVPPEYWKYLLHKQTAGERNVIVEDEGRFPKNYQFAGKRSGKSEVNESQVNFYRILHFCKEEDKSFMGKSHRPSYLASAFQRHLENASGERGSEFGRILCAILVKFFDSRFIETNPPKAKARIAYMVECGKILKGYEALKRDVLTSRGFNVWAQKLVLPGDLSESFPYAINEDDALSHEIIEYMTDDDAEPDELHELQNPSLKVPVFKSQREIPVSTEDALAQAEEDLATEESKVQHFVNQAGQCQDRADNLKLRILALKKQLSREHTDSKVVNELANKLGIDEYLQSGEEVPVVYLAVKNYWKQTGLPWDVYWPLLKTKLDIVSSELHQVLQGTNQTPDNEGEPVQLGESCSDQLFQNVLSSQVPEFVEEVLVSGESSDRQVQPESGYTGSNGRNGDEFEIEDSTSNNCSITVPTGVKVALANAQHVRKPKPNAGRSLMLDAGKAIRANESPGSKITRKASQVEDHSEKASKRRRTELEKLCATLDESVVERK